MKAAKIKPLPVTKQDSEFLELRAWMQRRIIEAFGLGPAMVGKPSAIYGKSVITEALLIISRKSHVLK